MLHHTMMENDKCEINDAFDNIVFCEKNVLNESYEKGLQTGVTQGSVEGYHLGYHRGCELGYEIGYYKGIVELFIHFLEKGNSAKFSDKTVNALYKLKTTLDEFPKNNTSDYDLISVRDEIRVKYKRICSLLKIDGTLPLHDELSY